MFRDRLVSWYRRHSELLHIVIVASVATVLLYGPSIRVGFLSDDWDQVSVVAHHSGSVLSYFDSTIEGTHSGSTYAPLFSLLLTAEYALFGWSAQWYHAVSLALYAGAAVMLYYLVRRLTNRPTVGLIAMIVFLVTQSHTEAVVWVAVQPHLLATLLFLAGLSIYSIAVTRSQAAYRYYALAFMIASLLVKEIALPFLGVFVLMEWCFGESKRTKKWWREFGIFVGATILCVGIYLTVRHSVTGYTAGYYGQTTLVSSLGAMKRMAVEMTLALVLPWPYRHRVLLWLFQYRALLYLLVLGFLIALYRFIRHDRMLLWASLAYPMSLVPFVPLLLSPWNNEGERYTYLPSVFFAIATAAVTRRVLEQRRVKKSVIALSLTTIILCGLVVQHVKYEPWFMAHTVTEAILASVPALALQPTDHVVLIGLPDNVAGGQVFRNALQQAMMETSGVTSTIERVPIYTAPQIREAMSARYTLTRVSSTVFRLVGQRTDDPLTFTGFRRVTTTIGSAFLEGWQSGDVGRAIRITLDPRTVAAIAGRVVIVYFSEGTLHGIHFE